MQFINNLQYIAAQPEMRQKLNPDLRTESYEPWVWHGVHYVSLRELKFRFEAWVCCGQELLYYCMYCMYIIYVIYYLSIYLSIYISICLSIYLSKYDLRLVTRF